MIVADASVWVSLLVRHDVHHATSRQWLGKHLARGEPIVAPVLLLAEIAAAIARRTGRSADGEQALAFVLRVPSMRLITVDGRLGQTAARLAAQYQVRGADAIYVATAQHLNIPLVTWDRQQRERAASVVATRTPDPATS